MKKCDKCNCELIKEGDKNTSPEKRVGPDQDGRYYRVDCSVDDCPGRKSQ